MVLKKFAAASVTLLTIVFITTSASAQNLVKNQGFETGTFTNWTVGGNTEDTSVQENGASIPTSFPPGTETVQAQSGNYTAVLGAKDTAGTLSQTISTVVGDNYTVSFYYDSDGATPNSLSSTFAGDTGWSETNIPATSGYQEATFTTTATSRYSVLSFSFLNNPGYLFLDNVSVSQTSVPEFSSALIVVIGMCVLFSTMALKKAKTIAQ